MKEAVGDELPGLESDFPAELGHGEAPRRPQGEVGNERVRIPGLDEEHETVEDDQCARYRSHPLSFGWLSTV